MKEVATVRFVDAESKDEAFAIIRAAHRLVGLALTLRSNGDIEVFLEPEACRTLIDELQQALAIAETEE